MKRCITCGYATSPLVLVNAILGVSIAPAGGSPKHMNKTDNNMNDSIGAKCLMQI